LKRKATPPRARAAMASHARRAAGLLGIAVCAFASVEGWSGCAYLLGLHGSLGRGMLPALLALWALLLLIPLPISLWLAWPALGARPVRIGSGLVVGLLGVSAFFSWNTARLRPSPGGSQALPESELETALRELARLGPELPATPHPVPLQTWRSANCSAAPEGTPLTLVSTFAARGRAEAVQSVCIQGATLAALLAELRSVLRGRAARGSVLIDVLSGSAALGSRHAWLNALALRPGLDGVCAGSRCLMPWQLLAQGMFSTYRPVEFIPDFQFGVDPAQLREALGLVPQARGLAGLTRIATRSYVLDLSGQGPPLTPLLRMRRRDPALDAENLQRAVGEAQTHVLRAQQPDGRFRYTLDPITGAADTQSFNPARQAGATLALCELGTDTPEVRSAIERSSSAFRPYERSRGELVALTLDPSARAARMGDSVLPLASLLSCAMRLGVAPPPGTAGLVRFLLALQRPDGGFWPALDWESARVVPGPDAIYTGGQAVLALVLLEARQRQTADPEFPSLDDVHGALERAMHYYANEYWSHPLRDFFYLEENWHCIAARAALSVHRNAAYEAFCRRYVRFKSRLILEREQGAAADFDGGFGFGNLVPPHNTGAAGFGEALAAELALLDADAAPHEAEVKLLRRVLGFLLRQHWSPENCFACATPDVVGGMSEHTHSLLTRIDFAQHAWSALAYGARWVLPSAATSQAGQGTAVNRATAPAATQ
jgi:hypothetical protein